MTEIADTGLDAPRAPARRRRARRAPAALLALVGVVLAAAFGAGLFHISRAGFLDAERAAAEARAALYRASVAAALERPAFMPALLARDPMVIAVAAGVAPDRLNRRLAAFAAEAEVEAIYLMDETGLTISASNHGRPQTFIGHNYGFRPYFRDARAAGRGRFFAIGATTARPGYFIAAPVRAPGAADEVIGVLAVKIDLGALTADWAAAGETVFVANADGVILLASDEALLYRSLAPLSAARREDIAAARQFGGRAIDPLDWVETAADGESAAGSAVLNGVRLLGVALPVGEGWTLRLLADPARAEERAWLTVILAAAILAALGLAALIARAARLRATLAATEGERRRLRLANARLEREIEDRREAERRLHETQAELRRADALAALGRLAASVAHELGQPLSAMRNYLTAAELTAGRQDGRRDGKLDERLGGLVGRMEGITRQLRFFARPAAAARAPVNMVDAVAAAVDLIAHDAAAAGVPVVFAPARAPLAETATAEEEATATEATATEVLCAKMTVTGVRLRLEQAAVNLLRNAVQAAAETGGGVEIRVEAAAGRVVLTVADEGPGLGGAPLAALTEPFATSRASGEGMGLGLAITAEILREHDGRLSAEERPGGGAIFRADLPAVGS